VKRDGLAAARLVRPAWRGAIAVALAACASSESAPPRDAGTPTVELCSTSTGEAYFAGVSHTSTDGSFRVHIADAVPAPPQQGENAWTVRVTDRDDRPLHGEALAMTTFIPSRGYGSARPPRIEPDAKDDSVFHVDGLFLELPGVWQLTFYVTDPRADAGAAPPGDAGRPDAADDAGASSPAGAGDDAGDAGPKGAGDAPPGPSVSFSFCVAT